MIVRQGEIVRSDSGRRIRIDRLETIGGQGAAYWATDMNTRQQGFVKIMSDKFDRKDTEQRIDFLVSQNLQRACKVLSAAPFEPIVNDSWCGHFSDVAPGKPMVSYVSRGDTPFNERITIAISLARGLEVLHNRKIAHGDLHSGNFFVCNSAGFLIDFDNFSMANRTIDFCGDGFAGPTRFDTGTGMALCTGNIPMDRVFQFA